MALKTITFDAELLSKDQSRLLCRYLRHLIAWLEATATLLAEQNGITQDNRIDNCTVIVDSAELAMHDMESEWNDANGQE